MRHLSLLLVVVSFLFCITSTLGYAEKNEVEIIQSRNGFKR